ncbi:enoyl-CoA hydratase/isomerase family protein [Haliangium sp.]|uniref:enoyl-CoA hydratase/isomerase family protein n=1 Tax=Haliangium sp. TaxID=2663208 RepID=UPI003D11D1E1
MLDVIDHGPVRELRLAHPPVNALCPELIAALYEQVTTAAGEGGPEALVLSGRPGMFSAGLDVPVLIKLDRAAIAEVWRQFFGLMQALARSPIPVVAAISGHSPAGGAVLALFCDYRIMAEGKFKIGLNEVQVGLPLPTPIYKALVYAVGRRQAERLGVAGLMMSPEEALQVGLVDELCDPEQTAARALEWAEGMLRLPPQARTRTRELARRELAATFDGFSDEVRMSFVESWFGDETQSTLRAVVARMGKS